MANNKKAYIDDTVCLSFGKRYLAVGVLVYLIAVFAALNISGMQNISTALFVIFSAAFVLITGTAALIVCVFFCKSRESRSLVLSSFAIILILVLAFCRVYFFNQTYYEKSLLFEKDTKIIGVVKSEPVMSGTDKTFAVDIDVLQVTSNDKTENLNSKHLITLYIAAENEFPKYSDCISAVIDADYYSDNQNNIQEKLLQSKVVFYGYAKKTEFVSPPENSRKCISKIERFGMFLRNKILSSTNLINYGDNERALLQGLLIGEKSGFSDELYTNFTESGFIHIASVSGMHTSYLFLALSFLLGFFKLSKRWVAFVAIPLLYLFCVVALFTPSVCRASIMLIVLLSGLLIRRRSDGITSLAFAAALLVTDNPYCLENISFLMSFGAAFGLLVYTPFILYHLSFCIYKPKSPKPKLIPKMFSYFTKYCINSVCLSLAATIGLAYFTMHFFGKLQWWSMVGNILMFPVTAFSFIGGYINCIIYCISENVATLFACIFLNPALRLMNSIAHFFAAEIFTLKTPFLSGYIFPVYVIFCVILYVWIQKEKD